MIYPPLHPEYPRVSTWERRSCKLRVSAGYKKFFYLFKKIYMKEMNALKDESLKKELNVINKLLNQTREAPKLKGPIDDWRYRK